MLSIINGPNLNLLGRREPGIYGRQDFESFLEELRREFPNERIEYFQSNVEGELVDEVQRKGFDPECRGIIMNPGAYSHYSIALADAVAAIPAPVVEVHISNIHSREEYRHKSVTGEKARGVIAGLGLAGYRLAVEYFLRHA